MSPIWVIAKRELNAYFDSMVAYVLLVAFLGFSGFFTWLNSNADIFFQKQASLQIFFSVSFWTLFFFIPALTMRQLAEEKKSGTIELLLTKSVTNRQVVIGKFVACLLLVCIALAFTLPYYITVANIGNIDHGATICGYLGLLLVSACYISIGLFASSLTNNQIVAFLFALLIGIFFHWIFGILAAGSSGWMGDILSTLSLYNHFDSIQRGLIDTKDLIFFGSLIYLGLFLAETRIADR